MRVVDFIVKFLKQKKINDIFMLTGYGAMYLNGEYFFFPIWKPAVWNSFCISAKNNLYTVFLNDELLYQRRNYSGDHKGHRANLIVLNGYGKMRKS